MTRRLQVIALALAASLSACSSTDTGAGGSGATGATGGNAGSGAGGGDVCSIGDYCSPETCRTADDELMELEALREEGVRHANRKFRFCDGKLAWASSYPECFFECGQCDTTDRYYDASGALIGYSFCTDNDIEPLPCFSDFCMEYGDTDPSCDGVWTTEGPCFGVPCVACDDDWDVCDDGNECTDDQCCFEVCKNAARRDGTPCEGGECTDGACTPSDAKAR